MPILNLFPKLDTKTALTIQLNYPSGYSGTSSISIYVNSTLYGTYTTSTSGYLSTTVDYGSIQVVVNSVPTNCNIPSSQSQTSSGGDSLSFTFAVTASTATLMIQLNYPSGYSGVSGVSVYVNGSIYGTYNTSTSGYLQTTVGYGTIQVIVTSVPSGLKIPSSQTQTSTGGDTLTYTFAVTALVTYTVSFTSSQSWTVPTGVTSITAFLVGGGGGGGRGYQTSGGGTAWGGGGGGGGYSTNTTLSVTSGESLSIGIGTGGTSGSSTGGTGGTSQILRSSTVLASASGGAGGYGSSSSSSASGASYGGAGGSGGGAGGYYGYGGGKVDDIIYSPGSGGTNGGSGGSNSVYSGGSGQGNSTYCSYTGVYYSAGGTGGYASSIVSPSSGSANTGNGGGGGYSVSGSYSYGAAGGSGIIIVRYTS